MPMTINDLKKTHPCFSSGEKLNSGRVHLPVSPECNITCKFCSRSINDFEERPGVASSIISPEDALAVVRKAVALCPDITVAGVAGPADALATPHALNCFRLIKKEFPGIIKCMSTNGLLLYDYADEIIDIGIDALTVTVNAVDPLIGTMICDDIFYHGKRYTGASACAILIDNQLAGIKRITGAGIAVKVNMVLIPEINLDHVTDVARAASEAGAAFMNLIPLIPKHKLSWCTAPDCVSLNEARAKAERYIKVYRHCQRCRADAAGYIGGKDISKQLYINPVQVTDTFSHG